MFDLAREVFVCACATDVPDANPAETRALVFRHGGVDDLARLVDHDADTLATMEASLLRGEDWLLGELDGVIVTYTFLSIARSFDYPALPGCAFSLRADVGYGSGAWTPPHLRKRGYRRRAFLEELRWLRTRTRSGRRASSSRRSSIRRGAAWPASASSSSRCGASSTAATAALPSSGSAPPRTIAACL